MKGGETSGLQHKGDERIVQNGRYCMYTFLYKFFFFLMQLLFRYMPFIFCVVIGRSMLNDDTRQYRISFFISTMDSKLVENHKNVQRKNICKKVCSYI